jgi:hypothetical protein
MVGIHVRLLMANSAVLQPTAPPRAQCTDSHTAILHIKLHEQLIAPPSLFIEFPVARKSTKLCQSFPHQIRHNGAVFRLMRRNITVSRKPEDSVLKSHL